jgi:hypothetical protein
MPPEIFRAFSTGILSGWMIGFGMGLILMWAVHKYAGPVG